MSYGNSCSCFADRCWLAVEPGLCQAGDAAKGKTVFARCAICHKVEKDGGNGVGPNLFGIVGRKSATVAGFELFRSDEGRRASPGTTTICAKWVAGPAKMVPGTKMAFPRHHQQRPRSPIVVAYLDTLK